jgi:hypothetical protein
MTGRGILMIIGGDSMKRPPGQALLFVSGAILAFINAFAFIALALGTMVLTIFATAAKAAEGFFSLLSAAESAAGISMLPGTGYIVPYLVISFIYVIVCFMAGIMGMAQGKNILKANKLFILGIVLIGLEIFSLTFNHLVMSMPIIPLNTAVGIILPVLYLIGAFLNKQAASSYSNYLGESDPNKPSDYPNSRLE